MDKPLPVPLPDIFPAAEFEIVSVQPEYNRALIRIGQSTYLCTTEGLSVIAMQLLKLAHRIRVETGEVSG